METEREQSQSQLTLTDIYKMRSVIDVASTRGTIQGKELALIGVLYNKLDVIVQSVEKKSGDKNIKETENTTTTEVESTTTTEVENTTTTEVEKTTMTEVENTTSVTETPVENCN